MTLCVIDSNGLCVNVVVAASEEVSYLQYGQSFAPDHSGSIGCIWDGQSWIEPSVVEPVRSVAEQGVTVRAERNSLLADTDWMALSDNTMSPEWAAYRQALRDVPAQAGFPTDVVWPIKPE